jgi:sulfur dioxygenase
MIFRQLFDRSSCTYTYIIADPVSGHAAIVDPVAERIERDLKTLEELGLTLKFALETHVHADHITSAARLRERTGCKLGVAVTGNVSGLDLELADGDQIDLGPHPVEVRATPGHTNTCLSFYIPDLGAVLTGDTLFVRGCGRTDFQAGDPETLYRSVHDRILSLPPATYIYPGHDYNGRTRSTVSEELQHNPRLGGGRSVEDFTKIMGELNLALPQHIDVAVPANLRSGADA